MGGGRGMMKFQCSFLALCIKSYALPFKIDSLGFEVAYFACSADTLPLSLPTCLPLPVFEVCWFWFCQCSQLSCIHSSCVNATIPNLWCV